MPGSSTVVIAREDLSIPGAYADSRQAPRDAKEIERRFFELVGKNRPDVIVLDLTGTNGKGIEAILKIRQKCAVPVLAVCDANDPHARDYRIAGAAECISAPVDIIRLNETILHIMRVTRPTQPHNAQSARKPETLAFAGMTFQPDKNMLSDRDGRSIKLTTSENDVLSHLLANAWTVCSRAEIGEILYGRHPPTSDRAIDVIVARLRKKLASLGGSGVENLMQTKFRRGYMLAADVATVAQPEVSPSRAFAARDSGRRRLPSEIAAAEFAE
jgi:two-component system OmpR family response regulator